MEGSSSGLLKGSTPIFSCSALGLEKRLEAMSSRTQIRSENHSTAICADQLQESDRRYGDSNKLQKHRARIEFLTQTLLKIPVFQDVKLCRLGHTDVSKVPEAFIFTVKYSKKCRSHGLLYPENLGIKILRNLSNYHRPIHSKL